MDTVELRPEGPDDEPFLRRLYASTRAGEPVFSILPPGQHESFLRMQFDAQRQSYRTEFPKASRDIVVEGDRAIGRLYVNRASAEIRIVDIALLPECRRRGFGGALVRRLMQEARNDDRVLLLHVEIANHAARSFYERLGFRQRESKAPHLCMTWNDAVDPARTGPDYDR